MVTRSDSCYGEQVKQLLNVPEKASRISRRLSRDIHLSPSLIQVSWDSFIVFSLCFLLAAQQPVSASATTLPIFTDASSLAGLASLDHSETYSAAAADYNKDGYPDVIISHHGYVSLWTNDTHGKFVESRDRLPLVYADTHGVSFIDLNNDTFPDIAVACGAFRGRGQGRNLFFLNDKGKRFIRFDPPPVLEDIYGRSRSITPTDFNGDGKLDLLLFNFYQKDRPHRLALGCDCKSLFVDGGPYPGFQEIHSFALRPVDLNHDGTISYIATGPGADSGQIYQQRNGRLVNISAELGLDEHNAIATVPIDYDLDGDMDLLFVHRTFSKPYGIDLRGNSVLFSVHYSQGHQAVTVPVAPSAVFTFAIRFERRPRPDLIFLGAKKRPLSSFAKATISLNQLTAQHAPHISEDEDGLFLWSDSGHNAHIEIRGSRKMQGISGAITISEITGPLMHETHITPPTLVPNTFYRNDNGVFVQQPKAAGLSGTGYGFDAIAADFNNDGWPDIYQVNAGATFRETNPANHLFINNGHGSFVESAKKSHAQGPTEGSGNTAIAMDYDRDGDLDLLLFDGFVAPPVEPGPVVLLRNDTPGLRRGGARTDHLIMDHRAEKIYGYTGYLSTSDLFLSVSW